MLILLKSNYNFLSKDIIKIIEDHYTVWIKDQINLIGLKVNWI